MRRDGKNALRKIDPRLVARARTDGIWAYSRRTEGGEKKRGFSTRRNATLGNDDETNFDFLLTTGHTARLAASVFWTSALRGV